MRALDRSGAAVALAGAVVVPLLVLAAETVESLGFDPEQLRQSLFGALRGQYWVPDLPDPLRVASDPQKVIAVETLGAFARVYYASAGFKKEYRDAYRKDQRRNPGAASRSAKTVAKAAAGKDLERAALDRDPKDQLRKRLAAFLAATRDVDFAAATHASGSLKVFDVPEYESKPPEWKMCYRAGKPTTEALRAFARGWLDELK